MTASAVIVWAARAGNTAWQMTAAWSIAAVVVGVMSVGLHKQVGYARQILARIREIEAEFGLPPVTRQVGRPGFVSGGMIWMLRAITVFDLTMALLSALHPGWMT